ncbi:MAG: hypothetical protein U0354_07035 [Candidatus Sericytochromatia bacterium]
MSLIGNNIGTYNPLAPNQTSYNNIDSSRFKDISSIQELSTLLSKGNSNTLSDTEYEKLINLLKMFNIEIAPDTEQNTKEFKLPSILSSTEAYLKVVKALMEVLAKLKEEEERNLKKLQQEAQLLLHEKKIEQIQKDMDRASEIYVKLQDKQEEITNENFDEIENFFHYINKEYELNVENTRKNPLNIVI